MIKSTDVSIHVRMAHSVQAVNQNVFVKMVQNVRIEPANVSVHQDGAENYGEWFCFIILR